MPKATGKSKCAGFRSRKRRWQGPIKDDATFVKTRPTGAKWAGSSNAKPPWEPPSSSAKSVNMGYRKGQNKAVQNEKDEAAEKARRNMINHYRSKHKKAHESEGETDVSAPSSSDIPGFYYDAEKKRYFKILPGHSNVNVIYTRESLAKKTAEEKRKKDIETVGRSKIPGPKRSKSRNVVHLFHEIHQGEISRRVVEQNVFKSQVRKLKPLKSTKVFINPFGTYENLEHMLLMDATPDCCDILGLWSIKETLVHRIQLLHVDVNKSRSLSLDERDRPGLNINISPCGNVVLQSLNKITNACWAPSLENPSRKYILYTTMCYTGYSPSLALFRNLEPSSREDFHATDFCLGQKATWTCAWNPHKQRFSVGTEKAGLLLDVETRRLWELFSNKSDVLAQVFTSSDAGQSLISGTRKGEIITHDLRSHSTFPVWAMYQRSPISSLKLMQDEMYLLASDFSGAIKLWDLRMRKFVQVFRGHNNQYSRLPLHVDKEEQILYTVGEDSYTRFWDLRSGEMLAILPPPGPASRDYLPCVLYSQAWGSQWGQSGLVMGMEDKLHLYDSSDHYI